MTDATPPDATPPDATPSGAAASDAAPLDVSGEALRAYFVRYAGAFEAFDAAAIAAHYAMPCLFVRGGQTEACLTVEALRESVESLLALHKTWDVRRARLAGVEVLEAAPGHVVARADWRLGRRGRIRWAYATTYVLTPHDEGAWRIASALTHDAPF